MQITDKQRYTISQIEFNLGVAFTGTTRAQASTFIGKHINESRQYALEEECNGYGLPNQ